jgi:hypothetical protein
MREEKNRLPESVMLRVRACAVLFLGSERKTSIGRIAGANGISLDDAAVMYTLGALKRTKARGTARNYAQALDILENAQAGDRRNRLTRAINNDTTAVIVDRINRINAGDQNTPDYYRTTDNGKTWTPHYPEPAKKHRNTWKAIGRTLGSMYLECERSDYRTASMELVSDYGSVVKNMTRYFAEYKSRLSGVALKRLYALAGSGHTPGYIVSQASKIGNPDRVHFTRAQYLYNSFADKDKISMKEYIDLVQKYVQPPEQYRAPAEADKPAATQVIQA